MTLKFVVPEELHDPYAEFEVPEALHDPDADDAEVLLSYYCKEDLCNVKKPIEEAIKELAMATGKKKTHLPIQYFFP